MKKTSIIFFLVVHSIFGIAQDSYIDSLWKIYNNKSKPDTVRHWALADMAWEYCYINPDSAISLARKQIKFAGDNPKRLTFYTDANNTIGNAFMTQGRYDSAILYFEKNEVIQAKKKNYKGLIPTYTNLAECYRNQGNFPMALCYSNKALRVVDKASKKEIDRAILYNNIGAIYSEQNENDLALHEYARAAKLFEKLGEKRELANVFNNMGICYKALNDIDRAMKFSRMATKLRFEMNDSIQMANSLQHMASLFYEIKNYDSAYFYVLRSIEINRKQKSIDGLSGALAYAGKIAFKLGRKTDAKIYCLEGYKLSSEQSIQSFLKTACDCLYEVYKSEGDTKNALFYFEESKKIQDTLYDDDRNKQIARLSVQYEFDKERAEDSIQNAQQKKIKDAEISAQKSQLKQEAILRYALFVGLALVLIFVLFIYNRFQVTKRQKKIIEEQKDEVEHQKEIVEEKNKEILDSIVYAKRLQDAILPPLKIVKEYLSESFIYYRPKDIVAGDFYFFEPINDKIVFAAADCTGHGVPGAMVSVVCANALNRSVKEFHLTDSGEILNKVRELVTETFEKSENEVKDGMDISLCVLDLKTNNLFWSGANNPIWIIRQNSKEIEEIKPDKQPIGKSFNPTPFKTHKIELNKGDTFYIFTDGYEDQFGGEKGKKFKTSKMKEMFLSIVHHEVEKQRQIIDSKFDEWKGDLEQVDDVCIIGIKL